MRSEHYEHFRGLFGPNAQKQEFSGNDQIRQNNRIIVYYYDAKIQKNQMSGF